jgi:hypothetical protein
VVAEELDVAQAGAAGLALLAQDGVLRRRRLVGQVGQGGEGGGAALLDVAQLLLELLLAVRDPPDLLDRAGGVLARALQLPDPLRRLVLAAAQVLELGQDRPAPLVELERVVEDGRIGAAPGQLGTRRLRVLADLPEVEQGDLPPGYGPDSPEEVGSFVPLSPPEYCSRKSATSSASSPTTMLAGMIAPEKPPLRIA